MDLEALVIASMPLVLAGAAFALPMIRLAIRSKEFFDLYAVFWTGIAAIVTSYTVIKVWNIGKPLLYTLGGWPPPLGIVYEIDLVGAVLAALTAIVIFLATVYSAWFAYRFEKRVAWYYTLILLLEAGLLGCMYTGDIFNLFVMIEVTALASYALVAFYRDRLIALEASIKYGIIGAAATSVYFLAVVILYLSYGTLNMADLTLRAHELTTLLGTKLGTEVYTLALSSTIALALSLWTFMYLAAIFPNHFWLPDAHPEAPTPISAILSGVVVNVGIYATLRFFYTIFSPGSVLSTVTIGSLALSLRDFILYVAMILGAITCILGALLMVVQRDVKRLLAYSTISHMGLIFMGLAICLDTVAEPIRVLALAAVVFHTINHAFGKSLLFLSAGVFIDITGTRDMERWREMKGVGGDRIAFSGMVTGSLHLLGVPPLGGFFSKLMLMQAFIASGKPWLALVLVAASAIALIAYIKLITSAAPLISAPQTTKRSPLAILTIVILIALCVAPGIAYVAGYVIPALQKIASLTASTHGVRAYIEAALHAAEVLTP
ncbi:MAG TPA: cation:proton antiporter [Ignisphaera aggregans]|uniref:Cation:proton antiporter n=1 Tax=Ignisphaera aggregans TaxID=334771 RepID=A0A832YTG5_9CREN|nr:cation:proton antiporter [Ignisphaera aggregans]